MTIESVEPDSAEPTQAVYRYEPVRESDPEVLSDAVTKYFDREARSYDQFDELVTRRRLYLAAIDALVAASIEDDDSIRNILSFGCGTGRREASLNALFPNRRLQIHGIDRSPVMRQIAISRGLSASADLADLTREKETQPFDLALCLYSFVHLPSVQSRVDVLRGIRQVLRPDARLLLDVFNLDDRREWPSKLADGCTGQPPLRGGPHSGDVMYQRHGSDMSSYMHYFTLGEISKLIENSSFEITRVHSVGHGYKPGCTGLALNEGCLFIEARAL